MGRAASHAYGGHACEGLPRLAHKLRAMPDPLILPSLAATEALAARLAGLARPGDAILLEGPLGVGKSALARAFLRARAGDAGLEVPSPTFTLVQAYDLPGAVVHHFDLWRLDGVGDVAELGWDEAREGIVLVEWPDRLGELRPRDALSVSLAPGATEDSRIAHLAGWEDRLA
ncbi:tRNA threonylcarbamoyladenosine biosynthesis protein TsaE [Humitalea rosea]|uniref:tRNA threonylcarbamoyladenosine biosynthesis protein TsaE n=2 Tax=Humitalea rosea TaxID=990373 RepID=A0A2W7IEI4_9PROT|nr:tRNA threonylcarbamoyladenosine biosynthesis protein TsaE [Humitalea rosea]